MTKRTQADRDEDLALGRELERKDAEIDRLRAALINMLDDGDETDRAQAREVLGLVDEQEVT